MEDKVVIAALAEQLLERNTSSKTTGCQWDGEIRVLNFIRSEGFDLSCPGSLDPDAEGKRRFRECLIRLMTQLAELIADNEASTIFPSKKMGDESGFPYIIELDIDQSWWDYLLTVEVSSSNVLE